MSARRVYSDPTYEAVAHIMTCKSPRCERCTPAPRQSRPAPRQRPALAAYTSSTNEEGARLHPDANAIKKSETRSR